MENIDKRLKENHLIGCIKYKNDFQFYLMPVAWWILDYESYSPSILKEDEFNFRNGIYNVIDDRVEDYLNSINIDKITYSDVKYINQNFSDEYSRIVFFIDFDDKKYINGFFDIDVEEYLPDTAWVGKSDWDPINYFPENLKNLIV